MMAFLEVKNAVHNMKCCFHWLIFFTVKKVLIFHRTLISGFNFYTLSFAESSSATPSLDMHFPEIHFLPYGSGVFMGSSSCEQRLFPRACSDRMRGNGFTLTESRVRFGFRKELFPVRVLRLPQETVAAPGSLEESKARMDDPEQPDDSLHSVRTG